MEHYNRVSSTIDTPHADDIAGIQVILELMNKLAVHQFADSSQMQETDPGLCNSIAATVMATQWSSCNYHFQDDPRHHPLDMVCTAETDVDG